MMGSMFMLLVLMAGATEEPRLAWGKAQYTAAFQKIHAESQAISTASAPARWEATMNAFATRDVHGPQ